MILYNQFPYTDTTQTGNALTNKQWKNGKGFLIGSAICWIAYCYIVVKKNLFVFNTVFGILNLSKNRIRIMYMKSFIETINVLIFSWSFKKSQLKKVIFKFEMFLYWIHLYMVCVVSKMLMSLFWSDRFWQLVRRYQCN